MIGKIKELVRHVIYSIIKPPLLPVSYSQAGEDCIISFLFSDYGKSAIEYLDLGTNHPVSSNNTYKAYLSGSTGVCVEADSTLIEKIKAVRPNDKVIHAGVSIRSESWAEFYIFDEPSLNTFDKDEAESRQAFGSYKIVRVDKVPLISINDLISNNFHNYPDFISVDIEGLDLEVLRGLDFNRFPVPVICVETCQYSENHVRPKNLSIIDFMKSKNYDVYADTYINTIFVNSDWFYKK